MSRGLGALQRRILAALNGAELTVCEYVVAAELAASIHGEEMPLSRSILVSTHRALYALERRGMVRLGSVSLYRYRAEVLAVWLPSWGGPKPFMGRPAHRPTRAVRRKAKLSVASVGSSPASNA